jgi:hypothetical protein
MQQTLRQREALNAHTDEFKNDDEFVRDTLRLILCGLLLLGVMTGGIAVLIDHAWPYITAEFYYIVNAVSAALN